MSTINPTPKVHSQYGAPMGRPAFGRHSIPSQPFILKRIRINQGGYDDGGAYWGIGQPLYWYYSYATEPKASGMCFYCEQSVYSAINSDCRHSSTGKHSFPTELVETEISDYIRADSRERAKEIITRKYPEATFKR